MKHFYLAALLAFVAQPALATAPARVTTINACIDFEKDSSELTSDAQLALSAFREFIYSYNEGANRHQDIRNLQIHMTYLKPERKNDDSLTSLFNLTMDRQRQIINFMFDGKSAEAEPLSNIPGWYFNFDAYRPTSCTATVSSDYTGAQAQSLCSESHNYCFISWTSKGCTETTKESRW